MTQVLSWAKVFSVCDSLTWNEDGGEDGDSEGQANLSR